MPMRKYRVTTINNEDILVEVGSCQRGRRFLDIEDMREKSLHQRFEDYMEEREWYNTVLRPAKRMEKCMHL